MRFELDQPETEFYACLTLVAVFYACLMLSDLTLVSLEGRSPGLGPVAIIVSGAGIRLDKPGINLSPGSSSQTPFIVSPERDYLRFCQQVSPFIVRFEEESLFCAWACGVRRNFEIRSVHTRNSDLNL